MKVNFLRKAKWYIVAFILAAVMLSVSLSFCVWDTLNTKASLTGKGGNFSEMPPWADYITDGNGNRLSAIPAVGDIVRYGKYYQEVRATTTSPHRWIVVDYNSSTKVATLLSEKVVTFLQFNKNESQLLSDYYRSDVRTWLNSSFLPVAFTSAENSLLRVKTLTNMKYKAITGVRPCATEDDRKTISDYVWVPSYYEVLGLRKTGDGGEYMDDTSDTYFSNFSNGYTRVSYPTAFANNGSVSNSAIWWLRTANPLKYGSICGIDVYGGYNDVFESSESRGIRPAVYVQLQ